MGRRLGHELGTALGVKLARPDSIVVCIVGDGAFHYNPVPAAFGFAQQHGLPILVVVCDNRGYVSQTWNVHKYFADGAAVRTGQFFGNVITPTPDYVKLVEAYGGAGERVGDVAQLGCCHRASDGYARRGTARVTRRRRAALIPVLTHGCSVRQVEAA